ncbi:MurR/RpiR family transcriptional regulator [Shimazuella kribbensis]|uniref:MurR/RpiR family transcriptional regulator n=1 Tax=Shimazuella kribbensis TaxID=139808 RepID=UPI00040C52B0|nr:MurR/RpiR family transcriptional regulator [Shimazuella kribbensis]
MKNVTFHQLIKNSYSNLSSGQKKVAEYILSHLDKAAFYTAEQIGREAVVSQTTVIRLSYALGFNGFSEMQASIQQDVIGQNLEYSKESEASPTDTVDPFAKIIEKDITTLREMVSHLNQEDLLQAVDLLIQADQILIVGRRTSYVAAHWFASCLSEIRDQVIMSTDISQTLPKLLSLTERSVVFVISFPRYNHESLDLANYAKQRGIKLISITDHILSPFGRIADLTFTTKTHLESGSTAIASILSLLNLFLAGIKMKMEGQIQSRRKQLEQLYSRFDMFLE